MPAMSPETNALMQGPPGLDPTEDLFKQRFADMAYKTFDSKFAELGPHVVTFKILKIDVDEGSGVGVLILDYNQKTIYVPVIMVDSILKPMEIFYYKDINVFLPLTLRWLDEIMRDSVSEMGEAARLPNEVPQDQDLRDLVFPPLTSSGRVGYASADAQDAQDAHTVGALAMIKEAEFQDFGNLEAHPMFLDALRRSPKAALDGVKLAFQQQPRLLQVLARQYGTDELVQAMQEGYANGQEKVANAPTDKSAALQVFIGTNPDPEKFVAAFGKEASAAFQTLLKQGYIVKDARAGVSRTAVKVQRPVKLNSPGPDAGWFRLFFADGAPGVYFVIPFPKGMGYDDGLCCVSYSDTGNDHKSPTEYLAISADGKEAWTCKELVGESLFEETDSVIGSSKIGKLIKKEKGGDKPVAGSYGFFINSKNGKYEATTPFKVDKVVSDGGMTRIFKEYSSRRFVIDGDPSRKAFQRTQGGDVVFVPNTAKFVEIMRVSTDPENERAYRKVRDAERMHKNSVVKDPSVLLRSVGRIISEAGAEKVAVKRASVAGEWWVGEPAYSTVRGGEALVKVASMYDVSLEDAQSILDDAVTNGHAEVYVMGAPEAQLVKEAFAKIAQPPMEQAPAPGPEAGGPQGVAGPMSPGMPGVPGMDPMMMGAPPAPGVSPTDLAIGEAVQQLQTQTEMQAQQAQAQMQQLEQQMVMQQQTNQQLVDVLTGIQQRSQEISGATGGAIPEHAMASPEVAAQTMAPPAQPMPEPVTPIMDQEAISPEMVAQQINPEMVEQVEELQQRGIFDTAAVGMLAEAPLLQEIVTAYVPNLEKGLDNLGRILLTLWMKEEETKLAIGDDAYISLEDKLRAVFKNLGEIVLDLSHNATSKAPEEVKAARR